MPFIAVGIADGPIMPQAADGAEDGVCARSECIDTTLQRVQFVNVGCQGVAIHARNDGTMGGTFRLVGPASFPNSIRTC